MLCLCARLYVRIHITTIHCWLSPDMCQLELRESMMCGPQQHHPPSNRSPGVWSNHDPSVKGGSQDGGLWGEDTFMWDSLHVDIRLSETSAITLLCHSRKVRINNKTKSSLSGDANAHDVVSLRAKHSANTTSRTQLRLQRKARRSVLRLMVFVGIK